MRFLSASIVFWPLLLIGALPAVAGGTPLAPGAGAPIQLTAPDATTAGRETYVQEALDEMQEWQSKLHHFGDQAAAKGKEAGSAAETDLNEAWTEAEAASRKLQTASAVGWQSAKMSFEKASRELAEAWDRLRPQDK